MQETDFKVELPSYAVCWMESHSKTYNASGYVRFTQSEIVGTQIYGQINGLTPNQEHAFHIHELGDLSGGCDSLASHFNPFNEDHGGPGGCHRHLGDLGNL